MKTIHDLWREFFVTVFSPGEVVSDEDLIAARLFFHCGCRGILRELLGNPRKQPDRNEVIRKAKALWAELDAYPEQMNRDIKTLGTPNFKIEVGQPKPPEVSTPKTPIDAGPWAGLQVDLFRLEDPSVMFFVEVKNKTGKDLTCPLSLLLVNDENGKYYRCALVAMVRDGGGFRPTVKYQNHFIQPYESLRLEPVWKESLPDRRDLNLEIEITPLGMSDPKNSHKWKIPSEWIQAKIAADKEKR